MSMAICHASTKMMMHSVYRIEAACQIFPFYIAAKVT